MAFAYLNRLIGGLSTQIDSESIDDALDQDFENESDVDVGEVTNREIIDSETESEDESSENTGRQEDDGRWAWSDQLTDVSVELFSKHEGPNTSEFDLDYQSEPILFFNLYFPEDLISEIVVQTNLYAEQQKAPKTFKPVTGEDIQQFLYINMLFGIHKMPSLSTYWMLDPLLRVSAVADVMSRDRYRQISRYFHVADSQLQIPRGQPGHDPMFKIRPAINQILHACGTYYSPAQAVSIDEAMIAYRGRLHFKQYIKNKPTPWGVKVWCCCDPRNGYLLDFQFYTGKVEGAMPNGLGHHVVLNVGSRFLDHHHHFYYDNYFSSVQLAHDLLNRKTYSCATTRQNRKHWPPQLKAKMNKGECRMKQNGNIVCTAWSDKRIISLVSTNSSPEMTTTTRRTKEGRQEKEIPLPVLNYNNNMGGVDLNDQLRS